MIIYIAEKIINFSVFMCFISGAGQLVIRKKRRENYNLALLFFLMSIILLQMYLLISGKIHDYSFMFYFHATLLYVFSPLLYYAYYAVSVPGKVLKKRFFLFFIPALPALAADFYFLILDNEIRLNLLRCLTDGINEPFIVLYKVIIAGAFVQIIIYHLLLIKIIFPLFREKENKDILVITIIYSCISAAAAVMSIPGYLLSNMDILRYSVCITSLCFIFTYFISIRHPRFLQLLSITVERQGYVKSLLKGFDVNELMKKLKHLMEDETLFLDETITLSSVSGLMSISHHQLSQLLNEKYNLNFNSFVNTYRVDYAKKLLIECPEKTVLAIAYESGFNSKSSFYDSFTKFTGLTPIEYRKKRS